MRNVVLYDFSLGSEMKAGLSRMVSKMVSDASSIALELDSSLISRAGELMRALEKHRHRFKLYAAYRIPLTASSVYDGTDSRISELVGNMIYKAKKSFSSRENTLKSIKKVDDYVSSMPDSYFDGLAESIIRFGRGDPVLFKRSVSSVGRATRTNVDGIVKNCITELTSGASRDVSESFGISEYVWTTRLDERVVGNPSGRYPVGNEAHMNHWKRHGEIFRWSEPPPDGHPGQAINCRCMAAPVI